MSDSARRQPVDSDVRLAVGDLAVGYRHAGGDIVRVVSGVDLELRAGSICGLVGESGCGKSTTALAAIGYHGGGAVILEGTSTLNGANILSLSREQLRDVWGRDVAYISQNAATSLNPAMTVSTHFDQVLHRHDHLRSKDILDRSLELLEAVGLPDPKQALRKYPHQFSGGQQQRVALAVALACRPSVLVLDEPTTGLDVTTQARISQLLSRLVVETDVAALYVSHDISLLSTIASDVCVMYGGEIVERGPMADVAAHPDHPYTRALIAAVPSAHQPRRIEGIAGEPPLRVSLTSCSFAPRCAYVVDACRERHPALEPVTTEHAVRCLRSKELPAPVSTPDPVGPEVGRGDRTRGRPLLTVEGVSCRYDSRKATVVAVKDVSFAIDEAETLGVVGLSGSGKSTLLRAIGGLHEQMVGRITYDGEVLATSASRRPKGVRGRIQIVFQDPGSSLNPRHTVGSIIARSLQLFRPDVTSRDRPAAVEDLLESVKLSRGLESRYPWELSGGQQQRVAIARAFAANPALLLCDEVTSSLDVSVQATIIELIRDLATTHRTAVLFVSHDLAVVRTVADRAIVMLNGEIVEAAPVERLFSAPSNAYTAELLSAIPDIHEAPEVQVEAPGRAL